ncbi:hypothetical protein QEN19_000410 [Hanseniaspora menglaensis]
MFIVSRLKPYQKLIIYGICTYVLFIYQLIDVISKSNNLLQVLLYLLSSSQTSSLNGENTNERNDFVYGNSKCFLITINFAFFNVYLFVNCFLIKFLFGQLRIIEIENLNNKFIMNIINEIISITVMINREYQASKLNNKININFYIRNSKRNYVLNVLIYLVVSISLKVIFWINLDRLDMLYNRNTNENLNSHNAADAYFTGNTLQEDRKQLWNHNTRFILYFYKSKYFSILFCLSCLAGKIIFSFIGKNKDASLLTSNSFHLFFSLFFIELLTTWAHSILNLIDFFKSKNQQYEITIKLRESMRHASKINLDNFSDLSDCESLSADNEDDDLDSDDEGIFGSSESFESKYRLELLINIVSNILKIATRFLIEFAKHDFSVLTSFFSNELLMQIHHTFTNCKKLINIYNKSEQLQELPSPTEAECRDQDSCIICMDSLYPTKKQLALISKDTRFSDRRVISDTMNKFKPKILPCGHYLHFYCLKIWFERSRNCPICRIDIFETSTGKLKKQQVFKARNKLQTHTNAPVLSADNISYAKDSDKNGVPLENEVYEEENKEVFHDEQQSYETKLSEDCEFNEKTNTNYDYKDVSNYDTFSSSIPFKTYKHKEPVYNIISDRLVLCSYDFYVGNSKFSLEHEIKIANHEKKDIISEDRNTPIKINIDLKGFVPLE